MIEERSGANTDERALGRVLGDRPQYRAPVRRRKSHGFLVAGGFIGPSRSGSGSDFWPRPSARLQLFVNSRGRAAEGRNGCAMSRVGVVRLRMLSSGGPGRCDATKSGLPVALVARGRRAEDLGWPALCAHLQHRRRRRTLRCLSRVAAAACGAFQSAARRISRSSGTSTRRALQELKRHLAPAGRSSASCEKIDKPNPFSPVAFRSHAGCGRMV